MDRPDLSGEFNPAVLAIAWTAAPGSVVTARWTVAGGPYRPNAKKQTPKHHLPDALFELNVHVANDMFHAGRLILDTGQYDAKAEAPSSLCWSRLGLPLGDDARRPHCSRNVAQPGR
jgi:hypothetical protein